MPFTSVDFDRKAEESGLLPAGGFQVCLCSLGSNLMKLTRKKKEKTASFN